MKHFIISAVIYACLMYACNSNKSRESKTDDTKIESLTENSSDNSAEAAQKKLENLRNLAPLDTAEIRTMLPPELNGMERTSLSVNNIAGYGVGEASYQS